MLRKFTTIAAMLVPIVPAIVLKYDLWHIRIPPLGDVQAHSFIYATFDM